MFKSVLLTSMAKVLPDTNISTLYSTDTFSGLKGEKVCFQISVCCDEDKTVKFNINDKSDLKVYLVDYTPATLAVHEDADDYYISKESGLYPDVLKEMNDCTIELNADKPASLYFEYSATYAVEKDITVTFSQNNETLSDLTAKIVIADCQLPEQDIICTHWFHTDCLCDWYGFLPFSDEYWLTVENYAKNAVEHGINSLLVPLFTPALDTEIGTERMTVQLVDVNVDSDGNYSFSFDNLIKWISLFKKCGIKGFEFSHFFTQWGALHAPKIMATVNGEYKRIFGWETDSTGEEYVRFLTAFSSAVKPVLKECDIENCSYFHVSDEPNDEQIEQYKKCSDIVTKLFGEYKIIDALSSFEFYKRGIVKNPVVCIHDAEPFLDVVDNLWVYYCCWPVNNYYTNRFFAMPSQRTRILGMQMYKYNMKGFLHWGYNFWYSQLSKEKVNPYQVSDGGNAFTAGDPFVVYPGENYMPVNSLRLKIFRDAFQDISALNALESLVGREKVMYILEKEGELTLNKYPRSEQWHFEKRHEINMAIKEITG